MSFYVVRRRTETDAASFTGPIRSPNQATKEAAAWQGAGWTAVVVPSTPDVKKAVSAWQRKREQERRDQQS